MPQSLSKVYIHIIFSTKNRENLIDDKIENSLYEYLGGICKGLGLRPFRAWLIYIPDSQGVALCYC